MYWDACWLYIFHYNILSTYSIIIHVLVPLNSECFKDRDHSLIISVTSGHGTGFCTSKYSPSEQMHTEINCKDGIDFKISSVTKHFLCGISPCLYTSTYTSQILQCFVTTAYDVSHIFNMYTQSKFFQALACMLEIYTSKPYLRKRERIWYGDLYNQSFFSMLEGQWWAWRFAFILAVTHNNHCWANSN